MLFICTTLPFVVNKLHHISRMCPEVPLVQICTKFGTGIGTGMGVAHVISSVTNFRRPTNGVRICREGSKNSGSH